jgi:hypothetical protein
LKLLVEVLARAAQQTAPMLAAVAVVHMQK